MALVRCRMLDPSENWVHRWNTLLAEIVYDFDWNDDAVASIRHLKKRIETEKNRESRIHLDFKYGKGGIADLEFLVQFLQLLYGRKEEGVRTPSVAAAIPALQRAGALSISEAGILS